MHKHPVIETKHSCFYPLFHSFGHYPKCVARGERSLAPLSPQKFNTSSAWLQVLHFFWHKSSLSTNRDNPPLIGTLLCSWTWRCQLSSPLLQIQLLQCTLMVTAWQIQQDRIISKGQRCNVEVTNWTLCTLLLCIKITNRFGDKAQPWQTSVAIENALDLLLRTQLSPPVTLRPGSLEHSTRASYLLIHKIYPILILVKTLGIMYVYIMQVSQWSYVQ